MDHSPMFVSQSAPAQLVEVLSAQIISPGSKASVRHSTQRLAQTMGLVLVGGVLLSFFVGEYSYMFIVLSICACGLAFAKYLYE